MLRGMNAARKAVWIGQSKGGASCVSRTAPGQLIDGNFWNSGIWLGWVGFEWSLFGVWTGVWAGVWIRSCDPSSRGVSHS